MATKTLNRPLTFGQQLFQPQTMRQDKAEQYDEIRNLFSQITDVVYNLREGHSKPEALQTTLYNHAIGQLVNAHESVTKFISMEED